MCRRMRKVLVTFSTLSFVHFSAQLSCHTGVQLFSSVQSFDAINPDSIVLPRVIYIKQLIFCAVAV